MTFSYSHLHVFPHRHSRRSPSLANPQKRKRTAGDVVAGTAALPPRYHPGTPPTAAAASTSCRWAASTPRGPPTPLDEFVTPELARAVSEWAKGDLEEFGAGTFEPAPHQRAPPVADVAVVCAEVLLQEEGCLFTGEKFRTPERPFFFCRAAPLPRAHGPVFAPPAARVRPRPARRRGMEDLGWWWWWWPTTGGCRRKGVGSGGEGCLHDPALPLLALVSSFYTQVHLPWSASWPDRQKGVAPGARRLHPRSRPASSRVSRRSTGRCTFLGVPPGRDRQRGRLAAARERE